MQVRTGTVPEHADGDDADRQAIRDLMDPVALEARLVVARARRAEMLAARAEASRDARTPQHASLPEEIVPDPVSPTESGSTAGALPENGPLSFPAPRDVAPSPASDAPRDRIVDLAPATPDRSTAPEPGRRARMRLVARRDDLGAGIPAPRPNSRARRTTVLVAMVLLTGAALGAAATLMLQFRGWQIAILPPAAEDAPGREATPAADSAPIDVVLEEPSAVPPPAAPPPAAPPSVAPLSAGAGGPTAAGATGAGARPPVVGPEKYDVFDGFSLAGEGPPATISWPAPGEPVEVGALPSLAPAKPAGLLDARLEELLRPAPTPLVMDALQGLSFDIDAPVQSARPGRADTEPTVVALGRSDMPSLPPMPQEDASPQPPPPARTAKPRPAIAVPPARIAVHFPAAHPGEAERVSAELADAGFADVTVHPVSMQISTMQVRYFHEADRAAAEAVAASASAAFGGSEVAVRAFTDFRPQPEEGLLEVWLEGDAPPAAPRTSARQPAAPAVSRTAATRQPAAAARRAAQQEAERRRLMGAVEKLLREQLR